MSMGACWILQNECIFEGPNTGAATFLESPSNLGQYHNLMQSASNHGRTYGLRA
uniref:Uncharacterized protein n=1 Tax=Solanum tuberosum TaxID=4113 RepID=M0ZJH8_SOLTU